MAKRQSRRSVSLNRRCYEAVKQEATRRGVTLAALVESALAAIDVPVVPHPQQTPELAVASAARQVEGMAARRPSRERQVLGDEIADAYGFA